MQAKEPYRNLDMVILVGFHPATRSVQSTPADNAHKGIRLHIEKERKYHSIYFSWTLQAIRVPFYLRLSPEADFRSLPAFRLIVTQVQWSPFTTLCFESI